MRGTKNLNKTVPIFPKDLLFLEKRLHLQLQQVC